MKRLSRAEYGLFLLPVLLLPFYWGVRRIHPGPPPTPAPRLTPTPGPVLLTDRIGNWYSILSSRDGQEIITGGSFSGTGYSVQVWDAKTLQLEGSFGDQRGMSPLRLTPDGKSLVVGWGGTDNKFALVYDLESGQEKLQLPYGTGSTEFTISPNGKILALGHTEGLDLRDLKTGRLIRRLPCWLSDPATSGANSPTYSPDGKLVAFEDNLEESGDVYAHGKRDEIGLFAVKSGRRLRTFGWPHASLRGAAFSPEGKALAVLAWAFSWPAKGRKGSFVETHRLLFFDPRTGRVLRSLPTRAYMNVLAFSPDGKWIATGSAGQGIQVWNAQTGKERHLPATKRSGSDNDYVYALNFTPDSQTLLVAANKVRLVSMK